MTTAPVLPSLPPVQPWETALADGLRWLYTEQPDGSAVTHFGIRIRVEGNRSLEFRPDRNGYPVVVVDVTDKVIDRSNPYSPRLTNPLEEGEMDVWRGRITALGHTITADWNGDGCETGSFRLVEPCHPALAAAEQRYHDGCQQTGDGHETGSVFCKCGWMREMSEKLIRPTGAF